MPEVYEGNLTTDGKRFGIIVARFNAYIGKELLEGALDCFKRHGCDTDSIDVAWVPGCFEIPLVSQRMASSGRYQALVCLGVVIRGSTSHHEYVCNEVSKGIAAVGRESGVPTMFGVLTTDTIEQAVERAGTKAGNKGWDAALGAIEMANLMENLPSGEQE